MEQNAGAGQLLAKALRSPVVRQLGLQPRSVFACQRVEPPSERSSFQETELFDEVEESCFPIAGFL